MFIILKIMYNYIALAAHLSLGKCWKLCYGRQLEQFGGIRQTQHHFVKRKSCLTNLLEFNVNTGESMDVLHNMT